MTGKKTAEMDRWLEERILRCGRRSQTLRADDRADEAAFEKIHANVYDIFRTVLSVSEKTCGGEEDAVRDFFARRAQTIPAGWAAAYEKAKEHHDPVRLQIEKLKLDTVGEVRTQFKKDLGGSRMTETEAIRLFKCLSDKSRLQILKSLAIEDMYVERLAERLGITAPTVSFHLKKLADAGAVTSYKSQYYMMYSLKKAIFETSMLDILREKSDEAAVQAQRDAEYRQKVIDTFFAYGKLKAISAQRKKERIILEEIVKAFAFDRIYSEREVNIIIADYHDDFCSIRWDMIAEKLLARDTTGYWRVNPE